MHSTRLSTAFVVKGDLRKKTGEIWIGSVIGDMFEGNGSVVETQYFASLQPENFINDVFLK